MKDIERAERALDNELACESQPGELDALSSEGAEGAGKFLLWAAALATICWLAAEAIVRWGSKA